MEKEQYINHRQDQLTSLRAKVADLEATANCADTQSGIPSYRLLDELREKERTVQQRLREVAEATDDAWERVRTGVDEAWAGLERAFDRVREMFDTTADRMRERKQS